MLCAFAVLAIGEHCATIAKPQPLVVVSRTNMIQDRIAKIEATLSNSPNIPAETRQELLALLAELKAEVTPLAATHEAEAESITQLTGDAVHQATLGEHPSEETAQALEWRASAVSDLEASQPRFVQIV